MDELRILPGVSFVDCFLEGSEDVVLRPGDLTFSEAETAHLLEFYEESLIASKDVVLLEGDTAHDCLEILAKLSYSEHSLKEWGVSLGSDVGETL